MKTLISILVCAAGALAQTLPNAVGPPAAEVQYFSANGQPLAGGLLYTYAAGTTTPLATYTDSTAGTPNSNPIILDSGGRAQIWIGSSAYKFVLYDANSVEQWSEDNILDVGLYFVNYVKTAGLATLISFTPANGLPATTVAAELNNLLTVNNAKACGATGNGSTDDTAALQTCINLGGLLQVPQGTYNVTGLTISSPVRIVCADRSGAFFHLTAGTYIFTVSGVSDVSIENCGFTEAPGTGGGTTGSSIGAALRVNNSSRVRISDNFFNLLNGRGADLMNVQTSWFQSNHCVAVLNSCIRVTDPGSGNTNEYIWIEGNSMQGTGGTTGGTGAIQIDGTPIMGNQQYMFINRNTITTPVGVGIGGDLINSTTISNNSVTGNGTRGECIAFTGSDNVVSDNVASGCGSAGILVFATVTQTTAHNVVSHNLTWNNVAQGIAWVYGDNGSAITNLRVEGNIAWDSGGGIQHYGLQSYASAASFTGLDIVAVNNTLVGNSVGGTSFVDGNVVTQEQNDLTSGVVSQLVTRGSVALVNSNGMLYESPEQLYMDVSKGWLAIGVTGAYPPIPLAPLHVQGSNASGYGSRFDLNTAGFAGWPFLVNQSPGGKSGINFESGGTNVAGIGWSSADELKLISNYSGGGTPIISFWAKASVDDSAQSCFANLGGDCSGWIDNTGQVPAQVLFASLPTAAIPKFVWCADCVVASTCAGSGTGAWAFKNAASGAWKCPF